MKLLAAIAVTCIFALQGASADVGIGYDDEITSGRVLKTESDLRRDLFQNYDKLVRPVKDASTAVPFAASVTPLYIRDVDDRKGIIDMDSWLMLKWKDDNLQWDPKRYDGISTFNVPSSEVWKPDLTLYSASSASMIMPQVFTQVVINFTGDVLWVPPFTISSRCPSNKQSQDRRKIIDCSILFGSWTYSAKLLNMQLYSEEVDLSNFADTNPDWQLVSASIDRQSKYYPCCPDDYPVIHFNVTLTQRPSSYKFVQKVLKNIE